ncbi:MAG: VWA domain-containing protein [Leptospirales bacterium]|nr:VWA domain-containing protein [Leptospirales bacterium]
MGVTRTGKIAGAYVLVALCLTVFALHPASSEVESGRSSDRRPVLFILDASGSMNEMFGGVTRMAAARVMLEEQLSRLDRSVPVGLAAYGNRLPGCSSQRLYNPIAIGNHERINLQVQNMAAAGATPIANTLRLIGTALVPSNPGLLIVLISDGAESCGGNPGAEAAALQLRGANVQVNVIGLAVDAETALQLGEIARQGRGRYFHVRNHTDFEAAIQQSVVRDVAETPTGESEIDQGTPALSAETLQILELEDLGTSSQGRRIRVRFRYQASGKDFEVTFQALRQAAQSGAGRRLLSASPLAIRGRPFFDQDRGEGELILEISGAQSAPGPIIIQGELWEISGVPRALYVSRPHTLNLR